jgi:preprotein translocase subunit YajC
MTEPSLHIANLLASVPLGVLGDHVHASSAALGARLAQTPRASALLEGLAAAARATGHVAKKHPTASGASSLITLLFFVVIGYLLWRVFVRPQSQRAKQQRDLLATLRPGDEVLTSGGIFGTVLDLDADRVTIEASPGTRLVVARSAIARKVSEQVELPDAAELSEGAEPSEGAEAPDDAPEPPDGHGGPDGRGAAPAGEEADEAAGDAAGRGSKDEEGPGAARGTATG